MGILRERKRKEQRERDRSAPPCSLYTGRKLETDDLLTLPSDLGLERLGDLRRVLDAANDPEADHVHLGQPPDALGDLRIVFHPALLGAAAGGAAALVRFIRPAAAANRVREPGVRRREERADRQLLLGPLGVDVLLVMIEAPFGDVAVHVAKAPRVRLLGADLVRRAVLVV